MKKIPNLDHAQSAQVISQLEKHRQTKTSFTKNLMIEGLAIKDFQVDPGVFRPDIMTSSLHLAGFLTRHPDLYFMKDVLDLGCGSGIQGVVMARMGAKSIVFSDISPRAVSNARANIMRQGLGSRAKAVKGDLFGGVQGRFDLIAFNHPFFPAEALSYEPLSRSMLDMGGLIRKFFMHAPEHLKGKDSRIVMPFFHMAGKRNDPAFVLEEGYLLRISEEHRSVLDLGMQKGEFSVYVISKERT